MRIDLDPEILPAAIRAVVAGRTFIDPAIERHLARVQEADELTPREGDVLRHLAVGASNRTIAAALNVSEETVKTHVANVLSKPRSRTARRRRSRRSSAASSRSTTCPS